MMTNVDDERAWRIAHPPIRSRIAFGLAHMISKPPPPPAGGFIDDLGPEPFAALDADGEIEVIGYRGQWYVPIRPKLRVRLHNRLIALGEWFRR